MSHKVEIVDGKLSMIIEGNIKVTSWSGGGKIVGMSPDEARAFIADVTAAIESIAPMKIDRWLTQADIDRYGDRWMWHSTHWGESGGKMYPMLSCAKKRKTGSIEVLAAGLTFQSGYFDSGDYFTPIKGDK